MSHPQFPREASAQRPVILERLTELLLLFKYIRQEPEMINVKAELNIHTKTSCSSRKCGVV